MVEELKCSWFDGGPQKLAKMESVVWDTAVSRWTGGKEWMGRRKMGEETQGEGNISKKAMMENVTKQVPHLKKNTKIGRERPKLESGRRNVAEESGAKEDFKQVMLEDVKLPLAHVEEENQDKAEEKEREGTEKFADEGLGDEAGCPGVVWSTAAKLERA